VVVRSEQVGDGLAGITGAVRQKSNVHRRSPRWPSVPPPERRSAAQWNAAG
jgi:hypothetical protein